MADTIAVTDFNWLGQQTMMVSMALFFTDSVTRQIQSTSRNVNVSVCLCISSIVFMWQLYPNGYSSSLLS